jgi:hypothetical protein
MFHIKYDPAALMLAIFLGLVACSGAPTRVDIPSPSERIEGTLQDEGIARSMGDALRTQGGPYLPGTRERIGTSPIPAVTTP